MTFTEANRIIREEQSIKMSAMTLKEKNDYVSIGARQIQMRIEEIRKNALSAKYQPSSAADAMNVGDGACLYSKTNK